MRFSACFRAVQLRGFFWPTRFISYRSRWCCLSYCEGSAYQLGLLTKRLLDGFLGKGFVRRQRPAFRRFRNTGFTLLTVHAPHITLLQGHVWNLLRQLRIRSWRGSRYRLGLPSRGQRSHTNASTTGRLRSSIISQVRAYRWVRRLWEARKRTLGVTSKRLTKTKSVKKTSGAKQHRGKAVRRSRDKKKDLWR